MFCVEEEVKTNEPCIIMELCTGLFLIISLVSDQRFASLYETAHRLPQISQSTTTYFEIL